MRNLKHNGEIESINGEKWSWESDGPPLVDKMDIVEALAPLNLPKTIHAIKFKPESGDFQMVDSTVKH